METYKLYYEEDKSDSFPSKGATQKYSQNGDGFEELGYSNLGGGS